jgi:hypothetical protein
MENYQRTVIAARDTMDEVARVISFMGLAVGASSLNEYERSGAQTVHEWAAERLRDSSKTLAHLAI